MRKGTESLRSSMMSGTRLKTLSFLVAYGDQLHCFIIYYAGVPLSSFNSSSDFFFFFLLALCPPFLKQERQRTSKKAYRKNVILTTNFSLYPTAEIHLIQISTASTVVIPYNKNWYSDWWFVDNIRQGKIKSCAVDCGFGTQCTSPTPMWLYELFPGSPTPVFHPSALQFRPSSPHLGWLHCQLSFSDLPRNCPHQFPWHSRTSTSLQLHTRSSAWLVPALLATFHLLWSPQLHPSPTPIPDSVQGVSSQ